MIKEPDWNNPQLTIGDLYHPAMKITDKDEAAEYFEKLVNYVMAHAERGDSRTWEEHVATQKSNLGYFSGYYDGKTMSRVQELFECCHPIFGRKVITSEEALEMGKSFAKGKIKQQPQPKGTVKKARRRTLILED